MGGDNNILSGQQLKLFDNVVKELNTAMKNSALYSPDHSICIFSIENLKKALEEWLSAEDTLDIGIAQDNLFCNNMAPEEQSVICSEVAAYLHLRGIVRLSFLRGIEKKELIELFAHIGQDPRQIRAEGGIFKQIEKIPHIDVQEVDYSSLLSSADDEVESEESEVWKHVFSIAEEMKKGTVVPDSRMAFLNGFLKDTKGSAKVLNGIYREAVTTLQPDDKAGEIKETVSKICTYFSEKVPEQADDMKAEMMEIISQLHPDLITKIFEKTKIDESEFDLSEEITKDLPDSFIADFIESLIANEDTFNENLLKVFDKLAPDAAKADSVVSMVADKLFSKKVVSPTNLTKLQTSIKNIFSDHPESNFMSQMHKITVDAVTDKKLDTLVYVARLAPLITKFVRSVEEEKLKKEEVWLLLNLLWLESNPEDFERVGKKLIETVPGVIEAKDTARMRDIIDFFTENIKPEHKNDENLMNSVNSVMSQVVTKENIGKLILLVPDAETKELEDIIDILIKVQKNNTVNIVTLLVDAFIDEKNPTYKNKYRVVLSRLKKEVTDEVLERLEYSEPYAIRDLFRILKEADAEKAHLVAVKLIGHSNPQVRWEGLNGFEPRDENETGEILRLFENERVEEIRRKAATVLLAAKDPEIMKKLFMLSRKKKFNTSQMKMLAEICGQLKLQDSFSYLKSIFYKGGIFHTKKKDELRNAALTSLGRLHTEEAMDIIKTALKDRRARVRNLAEILIKLDSGTEKQKEDGEYAGGGHKG